MPLISPPNVPIPVVEPIETNGYWTVKISSASRIETIWCTADVSPQDTLTRDLTELSISLLRVAYVKTLDVPVTYPDSSLTLLSAPAGWSDTAKRYVPIPAVVVPNPTIFALASKSLPTLFSICSLIKLFSSFAVIIPTALWLFDNFLST